jgi:nitroreductase
MRLRYFGTEGRQTVSFLDLVHKRFSVRAYEPAPVPEESLAAVLEAGRLAPSAANKQPWHFVVVRDAARRQELGAAYGREWFWKAPAIIVVCVEPAKAWVRADGKNYADVDGAIAMDHMTLCAADLGLGTCWIGAFDTARLRRVLGLPAGVEPVAMTPLGKPAEPVRAKSRKALKEIIRQEKW